MFVCLIICVVELRCYGCCDPCVKDVCMYIIVNSIHPVCILYRKGMSEIHCTWKYTFISYSHNSTTKSFIKILKFLKCKHYN